MTFFFWADLHINHANILSYTNRPWSSVTEMNEALVTAWNETVGPNDDIYFLGDFMMGGNLEEHAPSFFARLGGHKHIVFGNHDKKLKKIGLAWASTQEYRELSINKQHIVCSHYPIAEWNGAAHGAWMLHGHCHGNSPPTTLPRLDVGVDCFPRPISFEELGPIMAKRVWVPFSHH